MQSNHSAWQCAAKEADEFPFVSINTSKFSEKLQRYFFILAPQLHHHLLILPKFLNTKVCVDRNS